MSRRTQPHSVWVLLRKSERNSRGTKAWEFVGDPLPVTCAVQPVREWSTSEEQFVAGIQMLSLRRIFARTWPGDVDSYIVFDGGVFETVGDPQHLKMSRRTSRWAVTVRYLGRYAEMSGLPTIPPPAPEPEPEEEP